MSNQASTEHIEAPRVSFDEFLPTSYDTWKEAAIAALKGGSFEKKLFTKTYEGITLEPLYTAVHTENSARKNEYPGCQDYLRGTKASGYIGKPWNIAQLVDDILPEDANKTLLYELEKGNDVVHLSCKTYMTTLKDVEDALKGINLATTPIHMFAGTGSAKLLGLIAARAKAMGAADDLKNYSGCIGADPIADIVSRGEGALESAIDEMALVMNWTKNNMPKMKSILIQGNNVYHNAGASAVQETAFCLCEAIYYIDALLERGLDIDTIAGQIRICVSLGANFFMEIAKLRAIRALWAQIIEAYGGSAESQKLDLFARTSYFTETTYDPYVNVLRNTSQTFSGVVGGVNTMQVAPFDEAIRQSDEQSRRIARNLQLMFQCEFDMLLPIDPAGGSWYIETLTEQLIGKTWEKLQAICKNGGIVNELKSGSIQAEINEVLKSRQANLELRTDAAVGTNMYANMLEKPLDKKPCDCAEIEKARAAAVSEYLSKADAAQVKACLESLKANKGGNADAFMNAVIDAFMNKISKEQICEALSAGSSDLKLNPLEAHRWTEKFEELRLKTDAYTQKTGQSIKVFLANMGPIPQHKGRADFITGFMEVAQFEVLKNDGFETVEAAAKAAKESGADAIVICSTDQTYPELVPPLAKLIKAQQPDVALFLAGAPAAEYKDAYIGAGIDNFISVRSNCYEILSGIQERKGMA